MRQFVLLKIYVGKETTCAQARTANGDRTRSKVLFVFFLMKTLYIVIWIKLTIYLTS